MDKLQYEKISDWIDAHQEEMIADLERLVRIKSVADQKSEVTPYGAECRRAMDELAAIGREKGFSCVNREYYVEELWLDRKEENVGIWSHMDVLPEGEGWEYPAFELTRKMNYLIGRGVLDDKGPGIAGLYAILCLKELGIELKKGVSLFAGSCEEYGMGDVDYYKEHYDCPLLSIVVDSRFPVNHGEKGNLTVKLRAKEAFKSNVEALEAGFSANAVPDHAVITIDGCTAQAKGVAAHSAMPQGSVNAIQLLCASLSGGGDCDSITGACGIQEKLTAKDCSILHSLAVLSEGYGGEGLDIACKDEYLGALTAVASMLELDEGHAVLTVNIRYPLASNEIMLKEQIRKSCEEYGFELISAAGSKPCYMPLDRPEIGQLMEVYNEILGKNEKAFTIPGGTYARKLPDAIGFGFRFPVEPDIHDVVRPGHGGIHSPDETIKISHFTLGAKMLAMGLAQIASE